MTTAEQPLDYSENEEPMPIFHYEVSARNQPVRKLITYASNEAQALGQITQAIQKEPGGPTTELGDIVLVSTFPNPTVIQVSGSISAA